ncbi:phosphotransferase [Actinopolymorpha sp. B9G3]|uniref:phosphotransferase n=1 Tax=Actinopolymorpha sp. B9G3 TaxID=3158970 RepID=UPI0032D99504
MTVSDLAAALDVTVVRQLAGGEWGAFLVSTASGAAAVLKPLPRHELFAEDVVRQAVEFARALRGDGYPIPAYLDVGVIDGQVFTLQEAVDGDVPSGLHPSHARQLIELRRRHIDAALPHDAVLAAGAWGAELVDWLCDGDGPEQQAVRRSGDPRVSRLLDEAIEVGLRTDPAIFRGADVVHNDFHYANLLVRGEEVVAVFDWEGARAGDSAVDLTTLAWYASASDNPVTAATAALVRAELDAAVPPEVRAALAARFAVGKLAFAIGARPDYLPGTLEMAETWLRPQWVGR